MNWLIFRPLNLSISGFRNSAEPERSTSAKKNKIAIIVNFISWLWQIWFFKNHDFSGIRMLFRFKKVFEFYVHQKWRRRRPFSIIKILPKNLVKWTTQHTKSRFPHLINKFVPWIWIKNFEEDQIRCEGQAFIDASRRVFKRIFTRGLFELFRYVCLKLYIFWSSFKIGDRHDATKEFFFPLKYFSWNRIQKI